MNDQGVRQGIHVDGDGPRFSAGLRKVLSAKVYS